MSQIYSPLTLKFVDANMEMAFANHSRKRRLFFFKLICIFGLAIHTTYTLLEILAEKAHGLEVRLFGSIPLFLLALFLTRYVDKRKYRWAQTNVVTFTVSMAYLLTIAQVAINPERFREIIEGLPVVIYGLFIFSGLWIRRLYIVGGVTYIISILVVQVFFGESESALNTTILITIHYLLAAVATYNLEKSYRKAFLEKERLREHELMTQKLNHELFYQKRLYEGLVNNASDIIGIMDVNGTIDFISNSFSEMLGDQTVQLKRKAIDLVSEVDRPKVRAHFNETIKTGKSGQVEYRTTNQKGDVIWVHAIINPILDRNKQVSKLMVYARDISDRKEAEINLLKSRDSLEDLNAQKNRFFSILSHDLRGTIGTLASMLQYLKSQLPSLDEEELKEFLWNIEASAQKSYKFLEDMLEWAKSQMSTTQLDKSQFDLKVALQSAIDPLQGMLNDKDLVLSHDVPAQTMVYADQNMITTAIRNVLSNAIKFSNEQSTIIISLLTRKKYTTITVKDSGVGIDAERLETLFRIDKFRSTPGTKNEKGTGLGLILCRDLLETNGGTIHVESEPGAGTSVSLTIPSQQSAEEKKAVASVEE